MAFTFKTSNNKVSVKTCQHADPFGNRCRNSGINADVIYNALNHFLSEYEDRLRNEELPKETHDLKGLIVSKESAIEQLKSGFDRITDLYIMGTLNKEQIKSKTDELSAQIQCKQDELKEMQITLGHKEGLTTEERLHRIEEFKNAWNANNAEPEQLNGLAQSLIEQIKYTRDGKDIDINVEFI